MVDELKLTVLVDNYVSATGLLAEHGLSVLVEAGGCRVLFDTGQSGIVRNSAERLGVSLNDLDALVLSHGHYDHTGGLAALLSGHTPSAIHLHPEAVKPKYSKRQQAPHADVGIPAASRTALEAAASRIVWTDAATEVAPGVWCTGEVPRVPRNDQAIAGFFQDAACETPDPLPDDQALFVKTRDGLVVIAGCAHSGIVNTIDRACELSGCGEVYAVIGGFHLGKASQEQLDAVARAIERRQCRVLAPCHCTGLRAQIHLRTRFPRLVRDVGVGTRIVVGKTE